MAVDDQRDPLDRATEAVRGQEDPSGWHELSESVIRKVRSIVMPAATLRTFDEPGATGRPGSRTSVSGRVLVPLLRDAIVAPTRAIESLDVEVDDDRCTGIEIDLICRWDTDLAAEGEATREAAVDVVRATLGPDPAFVPDRDIRVRVVDIAEHDPRVE